MLFHIIYFCLWGGPVIFFLYSLINKKLNKKINTIYLKSKYVVLQYSMPFKSLGLVHFLFLFLKKLILLFRDVLN